MTQEEITVRSTYILLACSQAVEQLKDRLASLVPVPGPPIKLVIERSLKRELGLLFRYWTTRKIWEQLDANEADAKQLNLALLRLFTEAFKLPRDGSGLRYAELSTLAEEVQELSRRITTALGTTHEPLLAELQGALAPWRETVSKYAVDALQLPLDQLALTVKEWAEQRTPRNET